MIFSMKNTVPTKIVMFRYPFIVQLIIGLVLAPALCIEAEEQPCTEPEIIDYAHGELVRLAEEDKFSGAILVAKGDNTLLKKAYGLANRRHSVPNRVDTKFNIGSINKSFTQVAIAQLIQRGKLGLDDKISKYLPDYPKDIADKVTVEHLINMSSGLSHYWTSEWDARWSEMRTVSDLMEIVQKQPLKFEPGTIQEYSNSGYVVLGAIIESVSGEDYYDYIRKNIYELALMKNTDSYSIDHPVPNLAMGYTRNRRLESQFTGSLQNNVVMHGIKGSPAGGGYSTLGDLWAYLRALYSNKFLDEKHSNLVLAFFRNIENPEHRPTSYSVVGGAPIGINAFMEMDTVSSYTVIVLSNMDPPTAESIGMKIVAMLDKLDSKFCGRA